ncbi:MAG TPA: glutaredoxin family protein [Paucimonas sp.]|nr:glutaredoxin family protein [Paucimonas sp.]
MRFPLRSSLLILLLCAANAHAQLYKWVGPDGKVHYSDTPPPTSAKQVERKSVADGGAPAIDLPFELAQAVKNGPVTLYTTPNCPACDEGRKLLNARGIPYQEKTVTTSDDVAKLKEAGGDTHLPFLTVGRRKQQGFEAGAWNSLLSATGYPETSILPRSYRAPKAEAAAPPPPPAAPKPETAIADSQPQKADEQRPSDLPPATGNAPPGFRF